MTQSEENKLDEKIKQEVESIDDAISTTVFFDAIQSGATEKTALKLARRAGERNYNSRWNRFRRFAEGKLIAFGMVLFSILSAALAMSADKILKKITELLQ